MSYAIIAFISRPNTDYKITSREYELLRQKRSKLMKTMWDSFSEDKQIDIINKRKSTLNSRYTQEEIHKKYSEYWTEDLREQTGKRSKAYWESLSDEEIREIESRRIETLENRTEEEKAITKSKQQNWYKNLSDERKLVYHNNMVKALKVNSVERHKKRVETIKNYSFEQKEAFRKSHSEGAKNSIKMSKARELYKVYKENNGKLKWNEWRHLGMPESE